MAIFPIPILLYFLGSLIERIEHLEEMEAGRENDCERKACPSCGSERVTKNGSVAQGKKKNRCNRHSAWGAYQILMNCYSLWCPYSADSGRDYQPGMN